ncbi:MAG: hydrogenase [Lachnospiraceae bacterium]|nr:hydrogenase [Lachnospiraceae bacterium]
MAKLLDKQHYKCAMGAMQTVQAIERALPILHAGPGCAQKLADSAGSSGDYSPNIFPCTSINEKDVLFGGTAKLRTTIENALKVVDADLYVVLTGCIPEIVGDDVGEVVSQFADADKPVLYASTAGFRGNNYRGHEQVIDALIEQYLKRSDSRQKGLVNLWADVPYQDLFWLGNIRELERLLREIGLTPNTIFGYGHGVADIDRIPQAELNILVSPWVSVTNMKKMEHKLGIPWIHCPTLPIGANETSRFLRKAGEAAGADPARVEQVIAENEGYYYYLIERYADMFLETRVMAKQFSVVADAQYALGITKFLVNDLGLIPAAQFVTDDTPKMYRETIRREFEDLNYGIRAEVQFETDSYLIHQKIREHDYGGYPLILGSYYEKELAAELSGHFLNISWPVQDKVVLDDFYAGYTGGIRLIEDIYSIAMQRFN